jgi:hypothetical protein
MQLKNSKRGGLRSQSSGPITLIKIVALTCLCWFGISGGLVFAQNVLLNGDLSQGSGKAPEGWKTAGWNNSVDATIYTWNHSPGEPATIEVKNAKPNDSYWFQKIHLAEGWYYLSASIRAEGVPPEGVGVNLSIIEDGMISEQFHGTTDWKKVGFYLKIGSAGAELPLGCRLGGFANLSTGKAFCRDLQVARIDSPPATATFPKYDLDAIRGIPSTQSQTSSEPGSASATGSANPVAITILVAVTLVLVLTLLWGKNVVPQTVSLWRRLNSTFRPTPSDTESTFSDNESTPPDGDSTPSDGIDDSIDPSAAAVEAEPVEPSEPAPPPLESPKPLPKPTLFSPAVSPYAPGAVGLAVAFIVFMSIRRLTGTDHEIDFRAAFTGAETVFASTGLAALKLWSFWALTAAIVSGLLLQFDPEIDFMDMVLAGAAGVWVIAYFIGQLLGPIRLFRPIVIWLLMAAGIFQLSRNPPRLPRFSLSFGQKLAFLAIALLAVSMILLQLGSPLAPYMDVLSYPASVQRILSFGVYLPFDNDPYGCWGTRAQTPGLELFYAMLAMGSHVTLGVLAQSGVMMPMAALLILATYRLGATIANDTVGGVASLLLLLDTIFRKLTGMRGTAAAFVLVALGLAFFFDKRRKRTLIALGALMLGTSVAAHAIDGGLAVMLAGAGVLLWLLDEDLSYFLWGASLVAGAFLVATPGVMIGLGIVLPYPLLPLILIAGGAVIFYSAQRFTNLASRQKFARISTIAPILVLFLLVAIIYTHATTPDSTFEQMFGQFPFLSMLALAGLIVSVVVNKSFIPPLGIAIIALGLLVGIGNEFLKYLAALSSGGTFLSGIGDIGFKVEEYWCPFFLVLASAIPIALMVEAGPKARYIAVAALLALVIYPWYPRLHVDDNYNEHSLAVEWGLELRTAANGFWIATHDSRWTMGAADFALVDFMRHEQASGRITTATHVLHVAHDAIVWRDFNRYAVFTGINDDPILYEILESDAGWFAGSRVRNISQLQSAIAEHPSYILEQVDLPPEVKNPPDGYSEVFSQDDLRLFRRTAP